MAKHKSQIEISSRCFTFLINKYGSVKKILDYTPISKNALYSWKNQETTPSAYYLQFLCEIGADMKYILLGKKG